MNITINSKKTQTIKTGVRPAPWIAGAALTAVMALSCASPASAQNGTWEQPFFGGIWNTPVNPDAKLVPANLGPLGGLFDDVIFLVKGQETDPTFVIRDADDNNIGFNAYPIHIPANFFPNAGGLTPNNNTAILDPDGHTVREVSPLNRKNEPDPFTGSDGTFTGFLFKGSDGKYNDDLGGAGLEGEHQGSGMSILGGTIRRGELTGEGGVINHAIKIELAYAQLYRDASSQNNNQETLRWPARFVDKAALADGNAGYHGTIPELRAGSLLTLPKDATVESLQINTEPGRRLFYALKTYGAYEVDTYSNDNKTNGGYDANFCFEDGVDSDFSAAYPTLGSLATETGTWHDEVSRMYAALEVVDSNGPGSIGG